jgi:hypothetical protein
MVDEPTTLGGASGKLRVFISWSLPLAERVAKIFGDWLEGVIQDVEAWVSSNDIEKGKWWNQEVIGALTSSTVGVVIMTPANLSRPWLNFEAGALTGAIQLAGGIVAPLLINVPGSSMTGPINGLQVTRLEKDDLYKLLQAINRRIREPLPNERLKSSFDLWWPQLARGVADAVEAIPDDVDPELVRRDESDVLEDLVSTVRDLRQDVQTIKIDALRQSRVEFPDVRRDVIYEEVSSLLRHWDISHFTLGIHEGLSGSIQLNIGIPYGYDENIREKIEREIRSIPKFKVSWIPARHFQSFDNTTLAASKAPPPHLNTEWIGQESSGDSSFGE